MKKECDANGLEYELMMQESAKERFMREVKGTSMDFNKNLVILKQKRQSAPTSNPDPVVAAPAPTTKEPTVGAPSNQTDDRLGNPLAAFASFNGKAALSGQTALATLTAPKLLVMMRERFEAQRPQARPAPIVLPRNGGTASATPRFSLPPMPTLPTLPTLPPLQPFSPIVQPNRLW